MTTTSPETITPNGTAPKSRAPRARLGDQVGRLMIQDLIELKRHSLGKSKKKLLSAEEKVELVGSLASPQDMIRYTEMRHVHDYLVRSSVMSQLYAKSADLEFLTLATLLTELRRAELDNQDTRFAPPVMTRAQYQALAPSPFEPVAVIEGPPAAEYLDERGWYREPLPSWREYMAEGFLARRRTRFAAALHAYQYNLKQAGILKTAVILIGDLIKVKDASLLISEPSRRDVETLNDLMETIPDLVVRFGRFPDEAPEAKLRAELRKAFPLIDPDRLTPRPEAIEEARRAVSFTTVQGNEQELYSLLNQGLWA